LPSLPPLAREKASADYGYLCNAPNAVMRIPKGRYSARAATRLSALLVPLAGTFKTTAGNASNVAWTLRNTQRC
jgi:hypothetical protein